MIQTVKKLLKNKVFASVILSHRARERGTEEEMYTEGSRKHDNHKKKKHKKTEDLFVCHIGLAMLHEICSQVLNWFRGPVAHKGR